jgi:hypothetical protein
MHIMYANTVLVAKKRATEISCSNAVEWNSNMVECKVKFYTISAGCKANSYGFPSLSSLVWTWPLHCVYCWPMSSNTERLSCMIIQYMFQKPFILNVHAFVLNLPLDLCDHLSLLDFVSGSFFV